MLTISAVGAAPPPSQKQQFGRDLSELSLVEPLSVEVASVSKKEQKLGRTVAAVFVITQEAIRRSGFTSVPKALRIVSGLQGRDPSIPPNSRAAQQPDPPRPGTGRILVVEDNENNSLLVAPILKKRGYRGPSWQGTAN